MAESSSVASTSRGVKRPLSDVSSIKTSGGSGDSSYMYKSSTFVVNNVAQLLDGNGATVFSGLITVSESESFQISFNPNPVDERKAGYAEIKLILVNPQQCKVQSMQYKLAVIDKRGKEKFAKEGRDNFHKKSILWEDLTLNIAKEDLLDKKSSLIKNNQLSIFCEVRLGYNFLRESQTQVCNDMEKLLHDGKFSDVTIKVKGKQFQAHKAILASRSKVFEAMFKVDCIEKKENMTKIDDVEPEVFQEVLNYIYFGQVNVSPLTAADIFEISDKYELIGLKNICEKFLVKHLEMEVVPQVLQLADMHQSEDLKQSCIEYLSDNSEDIKHSTWRILQNHPDITYKLFCDVSSKSKIEEPRTPPNSGRCRSCNCLPNRAPVHQRAGANQQPHRPNADLHALFRPNLLNAFHDPRPAGNNHRHLFNDALFDQLLHINHAPANNGLQRHHNFRNAPGRPNAAAAAGGNQNAGNAADEDRFGPRLV